MKLTNSLKQLPKMTNGMSCFLMETTSKIESDIFPVVLFLYECVLRKVYLKFSLQEDRQLKCKCFGEMTV